jgi:adenylosuccinate synthase
LASGRYFTAWEEEFFEDLEFFKQLNIVNGEYFINNQIKAGKESIGEGAQGSMLDIDFGTFPYVTSSIRFLQAYCSGLGVAPQQIRDVIGVTKLIVQE